MVRGWVEGEPAEYQSNLWQWVECVVTKYECEILDDGGDCICVGVRTADNCYSITPSINHKCYSIKIN